VVKFSAYRFFQFFNFVGFFPGETGATEVAVGCGLAVDGAQEIQGFNDSRRGKITGAIEVTPSRPREQEFFASMEFVRQKREILHLIN
jgi:hypothetical protein